MELEIRYISYPVYNIPLLSIIANANFNYKLEFACGYLFKLSNSQVPQWWMSVSLWLHWCTVKSFYRLEEAKWKWIKIKVEGWNEIRVSWSTKSGIWIVIEFYENCGKRRTVFFIDILGTKNCLLSWSSKRWSFRIGFDGPKMMEEVCFIWRDRKKLKTRNQQIQAIALYDTSPLIFPLGYSLGFNWIITLLFTNKIYRAWNNTKRPLWWDHHFMWKLFEGNKKYSGTNWAFRPPARWRNDG